MLSSVLALTQIADSGASGQEHLIEGFNYVNSAAAQGVWLNGEGTPPVETAGIEGRRGLRIPAPFSNGIERTIHDRAVSLDLSAHGYFELEVFVENPEAFNSLTLYFRSGNGWYSASSALRQKGVQHILFNRAAFRREGQHTGWGAITGIRLSAWAAAPIDSSLVVNRLIGLSHKIAIILPPSSASGSSSHLYSAQSIAERLSKMLEEIGLWADTFESESISTETLKDRHLAILPLNEDVPEKVADALGNFVEGGGKLFVTYTLAESVAKLLHLRHVRWMREERPGQFAIIRLKAPEIARIPKSVKQASWNITLAEPTDNQMRAIGYWYDDQGNATGYPALFIGGNGVFMSHILLSDDWHTKQKMLAELFVHLVPEFQQQIAESAMARMATAGHLTSPDEIAAFIESATQRKAGKEFRRSEKLARKAQSWYNQGDFLEAVDSARAARDALSHAYMLSHPSSKREGRAVWNHTGTGAYPGDWDRSARELANAGFNMVLPNMLRGGLAHYPSEFLPASETFLEYGDQIAQCVKAAHKHGLEVHVWKVNWNLEGTPDYVKRKLHEAGRTQVSRTGKSINWLCPSHPDNVRLELASLLEVVTKYDVDGIHLDYIRYPGAESCYCDNCHERFVRATRQTVRTWPSDVLKPGPLKEAYLNWRAEQITRLVRLIHKQVRPVRPNLKISAAVFGNYPECVKGIGQDWVTWAKAGYVDFLCPMDYTDDDHRFSELVQRQLELIPQSVPIYPGIGATAARSILPPDRVVGQIHLAREAGAAGFTIFDYSTSIAETVIPAIGKGVGKTEATPAHAR